ncbi:MAG: virB8 family protein [Pseudoalteromonas prydzensis]|uniref:virB8 family protein n=1 Tax=Pseudoalteromonas prydzensis TaxID=182141 RepID=UPI003F9D03F3
MTSTVDKALADNKGEVSSSSKKVSNKAVDSYLKEISAFESDRVQLAKDSAKTAWKVAAGAGAIAFAAVIAVAALTPLKQTEPYLMRVDNSDGSVKIMRPLQDAEPISYGDVLDKYWSRQFIYARNGYDWESVQHSYNLVNLMSNNSVASAYVAYIKAPNSPVNTFTDKKKIKINIQDVTFLPTKSTTQKLAQVRFSRDVQGVDGVTAVGIKPTYWNATITYDYQANIKTADERELNPLGFRVTSYNEDRVLKK